MAERAARLRRRTLCRGVNEARLLDGRRVSAVYDWARDWWVVTLEGEGRRAAEGRHLGLALMEILDITPGAQPDWFADAVHQLAGRRTSLGRRFRCRCCGYLTLNRFGHYDGCPVCLWEDDPTTIFLPGERGGPGPNHLSLTEGRQNFATHGLALVWLEGKLPVRAPLPGEHP